MLSRFSVARTSDPHARITGSLKVFAQFGQAPGQSIKNVLIFITAAAANSLRGSMLIGSPETPKPGLAVHHLILWSGELPRSAFQQVSMASRVLSSGDPDRRTLGLREYDCQIDAFDLHEQTEVSI